MQRKDCEEKLRQYEERAVAAEKSQKTAEEAAKIRYYGQCGTSTLLYGTYLVGQCLTSTYCTVGYLPTVLSLDGDTKFCRIQCCGSVCGRIGIIWPDRDRYPGPPADSDPDLCPFEPNTV